MITGLHAASVPVQSVLRYGCCWTELVVTTLCIVHVRMYCSSCTHVQYCIFHCPKFHCTQRSAVHPPSKSGISLWSTRIARQQSENSAPAQPLTGIPPHHPEKNQNKNSVCDKRVKQAAMCCPQCKGQEDWRQEVSISTCLFWLVARHEFFSFPLVLLT